MFDVCDLVGGKFFVISLAILIVFKTEATIEHSAASSQQLRLSNSPAEYKLFGQVNGQVQLPCLIGRQLYCGEPYFIAWYKYNSTSHSWARFDYKTLDQNDVSNELSNSLLANRSLGDRMKFVFQRSADGSQRQNSRLPCETQYPSPSQQTQQQAGNSLNGKQTSQSSSNYNGANENNFDCAYLSINSLDLNDEGQFKCEITFSESLDFEKCPATTLSQLNVISRPNEPELLVNGRQASVIQAQQQQQQLAFKEGSQVKLDCQSSGGRPAPKIEWLNVSWPLGAGDLLAAPNDRELLKSLASLPADRVQLMRNWWPHKKSTHLISSPAIGVDLASAGSEQQQQANAQTSGALPITSSSVTISLSRFDLQSHFVCLVVAQHHQQAVHSSLGPLPSQNLYPSEATRGQAYLSSLLSTSNKVELPMLKGIRLNVQVKPTSVKIQVKDIESDQMLQLNSMLLNGKIVQHQSQVNQQQDVSFYSLKLKKIYAIQCVVENSQPKSQVTWFNRTSPINVDQVQLNSSSQSDYLFPSNPESHRLTSFSRSIENANGTFRTIGTLLLTTSVWDNCEELFCRVSNEAFQFDEVIQVAPIISARLYVNYAPFAWLETMPPSDKRQITTNRMVSEESGIRVDSNSDLTLKCSVAANPLSQNTILQIDWLKDNRKLTQTPLAATSLNQSRPLLARQQKQQAARILIEKTNHLHMPQQQQQQQQLQGLNSFVDSNIAIKQLISSGKLIGVSTLTIKSLAKSDSGLYTCQFKLIPAPGSQAGSGPNGTPASQQQQIRITSGQANGGMQVHVVEAKPKAPVIKILSSSSKLALYGPSAVFNADEELTIEQQQEYLFKLTTVVGGENSLLSLKCDFPQLSEASNVHKIMWYLNGAFLHSSSPLELFNFTISGTSFARQISGFLTCSHHVLTSASAAGQNVADTSFHGNSVKVYQSINQINFRPRVKARLIERRDLMPLVRSFTGLELNMNSELNKLKLTCLAACEPALCSIKWFFRASGPSVSPVDDYQLFMGPSNQSKPVVLTLSKDDKQSTVILYKINQEYDQKLVDSLLTVGRLISNANGTDTQFAWFKDSKSTLFNGDNDNAEIDTSSISLQTNDANVVSQLELTYSQVSQLLSSNDDRLEIKCKVETDTNLFRFNTLDANQWFPSDDSMFHGFRQIPTSDNKDGQSIGIEENESDIDKFSMRSLDPVTMLQQDKFPEEMRTKIFLERPPKSVEIFYGANQYPLNQLSLTETQLRNLLNENSKIPPVLNCLAKGNSYPPIYYQWTFTDLNHTIHPLQVYSNQLNLKEFIETSQRSINTEPLGFDVLSSRLGNYTCQAGNIHGTKTATVALQVLDHPLCKLTLGNEYLNSDDELMTNLHCNVYSLPPLVETVWFRNNQKLFTNKTKVVQDESVLNDIQLPVMILNRNQNFMLNDLMNQASYFKCVAKNVIGYSESCELNQQDKQILLNLLKPMTNSKSPILSSMLSVVPTFGDKFANITLQAEPTGQTTSQSVLSMARFFANNLDWLLAIACLIALTWILLVLSTSFLKKRYNPQRKLHHLKNQNTSWRFSTLDAHNPNDIAGGGPLENQIKLYQNQATGAMSSVNYYGESNGGDSEHEIIQSSQSSHYEDFINHQQRLLLLQQQQQESTISGQSQPIYGAFSSAGTLNNRQQQLKSSLSTSSTGGDSSTGSRKYQLARLGNNREFAGTMLLAGRNTTNQFHDNKQQQQPPLTMAHSNVPLVNGAHNSRINLDLQQSQLGATAQRLPSRAGPMTGNYQHQPKQTFGTTGKTIYQPTNEPIYDDVIYNQMIL